MPGKEAKATKVDILKKIEAILRQEINLDARSVFAKIEHLLASPEQAEGSGSGGIGYVHIDEKRQEEYLQWEESIKQEWLAAIEDIRKSIQRAQGMMEYLIVFVVVVGVIIIAARMFGPGVQGSIRDLSGQVKNAASMADPKK